MPEEKEPVSYDSPFNLKNLPEIVSIYKIPIFIGTIGIILLISAVVLVVKATFPSSQVIFTSEASVSAKSKIWIDITGAVIKPGVYEFDEGERIADALTAAGGISADADRDWVAKNLNRAAKLVDGGKIYIPQTTEIAFDQAQSSNVKAQNLNDSGNSRNLLGVTSNLVNINTATQSELEALPGVGPVTTAKIISGRPYQSVEELITRKIIGKTLYEKLKDLLVVY